MLALLRAYRKNDPAARSLLEVALLYPGIRAIAFHRVAHFLWKNGMRLPARAVSEVARLLSGIEIHPGATLASPVIIDHGMGIVIGETAVVGKDVLLYQGVTLGGTSLVPGKRHPTIESGVVLGAGSKILGNITVGEGSRVGANSVVISDVPARSTVVGIPAKLVAKGIAPGQELNHDYII